MLLECKLAEEETQAQAEAADTAVGALGAGRAGEGPAALPASPSTAVQKAAWPSRVCLPTVRRWLDPRSWQPVTGWPLLITYFTITIAQALPGTAVGLMLANELHFGSDQVYQFRSATFVPWTIRPVYAFVSDQVPLGQYRRRPYFLLCALLACVSQVCMALFGGSKRNFLVLAVATQVFLAFCEVVCDSLSVEWGNELAARVGSRIAAEHGSTRSRENSSSNSSSSNCATRKINEQPTLDPSPSKRSSRSDALQREWSAPLLPPDSMASDGASSIPARFSPEPERAAVDATSLHVRSVCVTVRPCSPPAGDAQGDPSQTGEGALSGSSTASEAAGADPLPPPMSKQDAYAARMVSRLLSSTADISSLTPLLLKSRIQSECMTVRCAGSVCASALSTWVMLVYLSPRPMLLWSSLAFLVALASMAAYGMERKVGRGFFGLAQVEGEDARNTQQRGESRAEAEPVQRMQSQSGADLPPMQPASGCGPCLPRCSSAPRAASCLDSNSPTRVPPSAIELSSMPAVAVAVDSADSSTRSRPGARSDPTQRCDEPTSEPGYIRCPSPCSASDAGDDDGCSLFGLSSARCLFVWRKFLSLLRALRLLAGPLLFVFLVNLMPTSDDAYYNFIYSQFNAEISDSGFSRINFLGLTGSLLGCMGYQRWVARRPNTNLKKIFLATTMAGSVVGCAQIVLATGANRSLGLSAEQWMLLSGSLVSGVRMLSQLPALILASYYAPKNLGLEASMFSLFAATAHVASLAEAQLTAVMVQRMGMAGSDYSNLWKLIAIANACALLPLLAMPVLLHPRVTGASDEKEQEKEHCQGNDRAPTPEPPTAVA